MTMRALFFLNKSDVSVLRRAFRRETGCQELTFFLKKFIPLLCHRRFILLKPRIIFEKVHLQQCFLFELALDHDFLSDG